MALCARLGVSHFELPERIEDDLRYDQTGVLFVIGGNDIPGRVVCTGCTEAVLIGLHVMLPEFPLLDICIAELPVLLRLVDARQKAFPLLLFREMEEELDDASAVNVKVFLKIHNRTIPIVPDFLVIVRSVWDALADQNFGMHAGNQNFLVIGQVEDANPPAFGKVAGSEPEKIVLQFTGAGMLEAEHLAALRINPRHDVPDSAVFSCRV